MTAELFVILLSLHMEESQIYAFLKVAAKHLTRVCHKYSNAFVFAIISIKWDQYPRTHGDDKQISLRPHSPLGCPTSCSSHNAAQLLHTRLCANKQTHKYTRRRSETAAPCASGPDRCEAGRQPFGCGVHQRDTKGAAALKS